MFVQVNLQADSPPCPVSLRAVEKLCYRPKLALLVVALNCQCLALGSGDRAHVLGPASTSAGHRKDEGGKSSSTRIEGSPLPWVRTVPAQFSNDAQVQEERKRQRKVKLPNMWAAKPQEEEALVRGHHMQTPRAPQQTRGYRPACLCWTRQQMPPLGMLSQVLEETWQSNHSYKAITLIQMYIPGQQSFGASNTALLFLCVPSLQCLWHVHLVLSALHPPERRGNESPRLSSAPPDVAQCVHQSPQVLREEPGRGEHRPH